MRLLALALLLLPALDEQVFTGRVERVGRTWVLHVDGGKDPVPLRGANPTSDARNRVQVIGTRDAEGIDARLIESIHPADKDLAFAFKAAGLRAFIFEYVIDPAHRHPGRTCRAHAWRRAVIEGVEGRIEGTIPVPAYLDRDRERVRVFARVQGETEVRDSEDWRFDGKEWLDLNLKAAARVEIAFEVP